MVIESLLYRNSAAFLDVIRRWSVITPPLFNHAIVLQRLQRKNLNLGKGYNDDEKDAEKDKDRDNDKEKEKEKEKEKDRDKDKEKDKEKDREKGKENLLVKKWDLAEAQAQLHIVAKDHGEALNCYLGMHASHTGDSHEDEEREGESNGASGFSSGDVEVQDSSSSSSGPLSAYGRVRKHTYRHVFELIEREVRRFHFALFCFILLRYVFPLKTTCPALLCSTPLCTALHCTKLHCSLSISFLQILAASCCPTFVLCYDLQLFDFSPAKSLIKHSNFLFTLTSMESKGSSALLKLLIVQLFMLTIILI